MTNHEVDNSLNNLGKTVLWQYDRAYRLLSVLKHMQVLYHCAVEQLWDFWITKVLSIDTCGSLGCSIWGMFLGVPRPLIKDANGQERLVVTSVYRKLLKGAFYLMKSSGSFNDILGYLEIVFGVGGEDSLSKWNEYVSEYGWSTNVDELNGAYQTGVAYQTGDIVWRSTSDDRVGANWEFMRDISAEENSSWDAIANAVVRTSKEVTVIGDSETILLKLFDPEGICRKIGGAPKNSLTVSLTYEFGDTRITASATRRRKCGITLTDNGDMSITYGKSAYYEEMHRDQKALFEQNINGICPYPLGIKTNEPVGWWVFGFAGQSSIMYTSRVSYKEGDIFGYIDAEGNGNNWKCLEDISAIDNKSFDAIKSHIVKTFDGGPFIGGMGEEGAYYLTQNYGLESIDLEPISTMLKPQWTIASGELFQGMENGLIKIFKNTSNSTLLLKGEEYRDRTTRLKALAEAARVKNCPTISSESVLEFIPNTIYHAGDVVTCKGKTYVVNSDGLLNDAESLMLDSSSPEKAGMEGYITIHTESQAQRLIPFMADGYFDYWFV